MMTKDKEVFVLARLPFEKIEETEGDFLKFRFKGAEVWCGDRYHHMDDLYEHRYRLYLALVKIYDNYVTPLNCHVKCWKSLLHDDGTMFDGDFILGMTVTRPQLSFLASDPPEEWMITYHLPMKYWHLANVIELPKAPPYDGHTPDDVLERLLRL